MFGGSGNLGSCGQGALFEILGDGLEGFVEGRGPGGEADLGNAVEPFVANFVGGFDVVGAAPESTGGLGELGGVV